MNSFNQYIKDKEKEIQAIQKLVDDLKRLSKEKVFVENDMDMDEITNWCFDNDIVFKPTVSHFNIGHSFTFLEFKNQEDAVMFKLKYGGE